MERKKFPPPRWRGRKLNDCRSYGSDNQITKFDRVIHAIILVGHPAMRRYEIRLGTPRSKIADMLTMLHLESGPRLKGRTMSVISKILTKDILKIGPRLDGNQRFSRYAPKQPDALQKVR